MGTREEWSGKEGGEGKREEWERGRRGEEWGGRRNVCGRGRWRREEGERGGGGIGGGPGQEFLQARDASNYICPTRVCWRVDVDLYAAQTTRVVSKKLLDSGD